VNNCQRNQHGKHGSTPENLFTQGMSDVFTGEIISGGDGMKIKVD